MNWEQAVEYVYHGKFGTKIIMQDDGVLSQFHVTNILFLHPNFGARKPYSASVPLLNLSFSIHVVHLTTSSSWKKESNAQGRLASLASSGPG